ncbi:unnamed protein product [Caenorhabditis auriculariae]|uniref:Uncharacterized protein n=1 Tax=Caenorhabditis auriculariae TaxID=2777116 RepID=A0A8S1HXC2_9PELO|nr:unnamed protein product [Caenorhabditis auriculariae]
MINDNKLRQKEIKLLLETQEKTESSLIAAYSNRSSTFAEAPLFKNGDNDEKEEKIEANDESEGINFNNDQIKDFVLVNVLIKIERTMGNVTSVAAVENRCADSMTTSEESMTADNGCPHGKPGSRSAASFRESAMSLGILMESELFVWSMAAIICRAPICTRPQAPGGARPGEGLIAVLCISGQQFPARGHTPDGMR